MTARGAIEWSTVPLNPSKRDATRSRPEEGSSERPQARPSMDMAQDRSFDLQLLPFPPPHETNQDSPARTNISLFGITHATVTFSPCNTAEVALLAQSGNRKWLKQRRKNKDAQGAVYLNLVTSRLKIHNVFVFKAGVLHVRFHQPCHVPWCSVSQLARSDVGAFRAVHGLFSFRRAIRGAVLVEDSGRSSHAGPRVLGCVASAGQLLCCSRLAWRNTPQDQTLVTRYVRSRRRFRGSPLQELNESSPRYPVARLRGILSSGIVLNTNAESHCVGYNPRFSNLSQKLGWGGARGATLLAYLRRLAPWHRR